MLQPAYGKCQGTAGLLGGQLMALLTIFEVNGVSASGFWQHTNKHQSRSLIDEYFHTFLMRFTFKCIILLYFILNRIV